MSDAYADCFACGHRWTAHAPHSDAPRCTDGRCSCPGYSPAPEAIEGLDVVTAAAAGEGDQRRIAREGVRWLALLLAKNKDYGSSAWKTPALAPELAPRDAILVRMSDKIERLARLRGNAAAVKTENYADTMRDLGAYALLWLCAPRT